MFSLILKCVLHYMLQGHVLQGHVLQGAAELHSTDIAGNPILRWDAIGAICSFRARQGVFQSSGSVVNWSG